MYLRIDGIQSGPFAPEDVSTRYAGGELDRRTMSWCEGEERWMSLGKRWPTRQPKLRRMLGTVVAFAAVGAAITLPVSWIEKLPLSLQNGTLLWCCVVGLLVIATLCLYGAEHGNRRPRKSLLSVVLAMALVGCAAMALALTGLSSAVLQVRQQAPNALVSFDGPLNSIRIDGDIGPRLPGQVEAALARHPGASGVELNSPGGLVTDALKVAKMVSAHGLSARVDGICASACVAIWAASPHRQMTAASRLGLHQIRFELDLPYQVIGKAKGELKQEYDALLRGAGFNESTIAEKDRTRPADMYWLDPPQVAGAGVALEIYDSNGTPVSRSTAKWLWLESILGKKSSMRRLMVAIRQHAPVLVPGHAEELYASFSANDAGAARNAGLSLNDDARRFALARASDQAVFEWGLSLRDMLDQALARHDAFGCALLAGGVPSGPEDRHEARKFADAATDRLSRLIEALPGDAVELPPASSNASREVGRRAWSDAMSKGYPAQSKGWSVFQRCSYLADYYDKAMQLPTHQAAEVLRYTKR